MAKTGYDYVPEGGGKKVVAAGEFVFASAFLDHGHIYAQTTGLINAGAECKYVYDPDPKKVAEFLKRFPKVKVADSFEQILNDKDVVLVASAAIPFNRFTIGEQTLLAGKHYFVDKPPFTTLSQLERAKELVKITGLKYMPYFAERIHNEAAETADELIKSGRIGDVLQVLIMAPHRLSKSARPKWFFEREKYGGILCDIGTHQFEQFLHFSGCDEAEVEYARVCNFKNPETPELQDFGEACVKMKNGASGYCRVDWFTPDGLPVWGDGRTFVLGDKGYMEIRKYLDYSAAENPSQILFVSDSNSVERIDCRGRGFPFFGKFILDILNNAENAMTQKHAFAAAELALTAQATAEKFL
ncbi:MAG: Gfo/Idh/MocA family oxidoreductase [Opitutales bacterium]|nr:Gfo/Idh/MocA family oxidoreductase [Opitutales bacterium]